MAKKMTEKEKYIAKNMEVLQITREQAEELWLFDHDEIEVAEVEEIEAKIEENKKEEKRSSLEKVKYQKAKKKKDGMKEQVIDEIFRAVESTNSTMLHEEMSATKISFMDANGGFYTVTVTKHKSQPDGYTGGIKNKYVETKEKEKEAEENQE
jgi:hypothetical protein